MTVLTAQPTGGVDDSFDGTAHLHLIIRDGIVFVVDHCCQP